MTAADTVSGTVALIDIAALLADRPEPRELERVVRQIDRACRSVGFFRITGHGIEAHLLATLDREARAFFAQPDDVKAEIRMERAGRAWRGWFPVRGELTSGRPDRKEGLYVGTHTPGDGRPLHGANLYPSGESTCAGLGPAIDAWMAAMRPVAEAVLSGIARALGLPADWFARHLTADPTILFRVFHYPALPGNDVSDEYGVGHHTDYGLLTLLAQDDTGGLEVRTPDGMWIDVPAEPAVLVCNIGDMLDRLTEGRYRSTPHRVRNTSGRSRLSFPYFFDPAWDAHVVPLPLDGSAPADDPDRRWDGASVRAWEGTYGAYLTAKVAKVFPDLFAEVSSHPRPTRTG